MCIAPITLPDGQRAACHKCWQCRENAVNDWVGRCIAESKTAKHTRAVTLTYGRDRIYGDVDHERAAILTYSDVQKYLKVLRRRGFPVRYFATGEFGSKKGRAHWHVVLFFEGDMPEHELDAEKTEQGLWTHGFSHWSSMSHKSVRYNCKYILKDSDDPWAQRKPVMSKYPPLGAIYFQRLAEKYVGQGLSPQDLTYKFSEVTRTRKDGSIERVPFRLGGRSAELFLEHFLFAWRERHGDKEWPKSDLVENFADTGRVLTDEQLYRREPELAGRFDAVERELREKAKARAAKVVGNRVDYDERWNYGASEQ